MLANKEKKYTVPKETKYTDKGAHTLADEIMREDDRVIRWKKVHELLRKNNKKARKEQDITAKDAKYFRDNKLIKKTKSKEMGLRWGVAIPTLTWNAMIQADLIVEGKSDLQNPDKESTIDIKGSNQLVKDLEQAFPQYKVS
jgi:hypothetical protein